MKRFISLLLAAVLVMSTLCSAALGAAFTLPATLTIIEDEAFLGNSQMEGVIVLPDTVSTVGTNAFHSTNVHALGVPAGVQKVYDQGTGMAYVMLAGSQTVVEGSGWAKYAIGPADSAAKAWADATDVTFVDSSAIAADDYFIYEITDGEATLLCAIDDTAVPANVTIPATVEGASVTALSANAFFGCAQVTAVTLPSGVTAAEGAYDGCPNATVSIAPAAPVVKYFSQAESMLFGSWNAVENAVSYEMLLKREGETEYTLIENASAVTNTMYSAQDVFSESSVGLTHLAVRAVFEDGSVSPLSDPYELIALGKPEIISAEQTGDTSFTIEWAPLENADTYFIWTHAEDGSSSALARDLTETSYVIELGEDADRTATYKYHVGAGNASGGSSFKSDYVIFEGLSTLENKPVVNYFHQAETVLFCSVQPVENAISYELFRMREGETEYTQIDPADIVSMSSTFFAVSSEFADESSLGKAAYAVRAVFEDGTTTELSDPYELAAVGSPEIVKAERMDDYTFAIEWSAVENAAGYTIIQQHEDGASSFVAENLTATSYVISLAVDADLTATYKYHVMALCPDGNGNGIASDAIVFEGDADPNAPANLSFTQAGSALRGSWDAVEGAVSYELYRMRDGETEFTQVETDAVIETNSVSVMEFFTEEQCVPVAYAVKAVYEDGTKTGLSEAFEMVGLAAPVIISGLQTAENAFTIKWEAVPYANSYQVVEGSYETGAFNAIVTGLTDTSYVIELAEDADRTAEYSYHVAAEGDFGVGIWSEFVTFDGLKDFVGTQIVLGATSITLDNTTTTAQLTAEVISDTLTDKSVTYSSLDPYIANVDENGVITAGGNGTTFIYVTAADGTVARCRVDVEMTKQVLGFVNVPESVNRLEGFEFGFTSEDTFVAVEDAWIEVEVTYLDAAGGVLDFSSYGYSPESIDESFFMWTEVYGAASMHMSIVENDWYTVGENASATVMIVGEESADPTFKVEFASSSYYSGSAFQIYIETVNPETLTEARTVTVYSDDGALNTVVGTISKDAPVLRAKLYTPAAWQYYDGSGDTEYIVNIKIGDEVVHGHFILMYGLYGVDANVYVGSTLNRTFEDYCEIPAEMPLTFAVEDPTIASISETGAITGLAVGQTTATVTAKSGCSQTFTITVMEALPDDGDDPVAPVDSLPSLFIYAPQKTVVYEYDYWPTYFYAPAEIPGTLVRGQNYPVMLYFYDADMQMVDSIEYDALYAENTDHAAFWFNPDEYPELDIHYVEAQVLEGEFNTVAEPSSAIVQIIYPEDGPADALGFEPQPNTYNRYAPGQTFTIPITCTTPELIDGTAEIRAIVTSGRSHFDSVGSLSLTQDAPSGELSCTLSPDAISGAWVNMKLLCGQQVVGSYNFMVHGGFSMMAYDLRMPVGSSRQMSISPAEGVELADITLVSEDETVVTVDENGLLTAVGVGETYVHASYANEYGYQFRESIWVEVLQAAEGELPVMSMNIEATEAAYGSAIPVTVQLSGMPASDASGINMEYMVCLLDANKNLLTSMYSSFWMSMEEALGGLDTTISRWPSSNLLRQAAYLYIVPIGDVNATVTYTVADEAFLLTITDIPEPGETLYTVELNDEPPYRAGSYLYGSLYRTETTGLYPSAKAELRDDAGNVYYSGTWYENDIYRSFNLSTSSMMPAATQTLYLYIDGVKTDCELSFYLEEPYFGISGASRLEVGSQYTLRYSFDTSMDYTTTVTFASGDESVLTVDENGVMTGVSVGMTTVTGTTAAGQTAQLNIIVYDATNVKTPEMYLLPSVDNADYNTQWFGNYPLIIGTVTEPYYVSGGIHIGYRVDFLDADGNVVVTETRRSSGYHPMTAYEYETWLYPSEETWMQAFAAEAVELRFTMTTDSNYAFTIDESRNSVSFDLPAASEHRYPIVTYTATENVAPGGTFSATFTCINPGALATSREVKLYDYQMGEYVATGYLTADTPEVTLTYQLPDDWTNGDRIRLHYPSKASSGTISAMIYTTVSALTSFSSDRRVAVGRYSYLYPSYTGSAPSVTYTSSDESVATVEMTDSINARVTGVSAGMATITITTSNGTSMSMNMVVYDSANTVAPVLWMDQSRNGEVVSWDEYTSLTFCTSTEPWLIGRDPSVKLLVEYLDADANVLYSSSKSMGLYGVFADGTSSSTMDFEPDEAYAQGARFVRVTMQENSYYYTLAEENLSVTLVIDELTNATEPMFVLVGDDFSKFGEDYTASMFCINPELLEGEYRVEATSAYNDSYGEVLAAGTLSAENPRVDLTIQPESGQTSLYFNVHVYDSNGYDMISAYQGVTLVTVYVAPTVVAVGSSVTPSRNLPGYTALTPVYSIEDESIAIVDPSTGVITGLAAGSTMLHVQCGNLSTEATVRVYDASIVETATLSLGMAESQPQWPWTEEQGTYTFTVKADRPVEQLGGSTYVNVDVSFYNAEGTKLNPSYGTSFTASFGAVNEEEITLDDLVSYKESSMLAYGGAVKAVVRITSVSNSEYTFDETSAQVEIPMISLAETDNPMFFIESALPGTLMAGETYTVTAKAGNQNVDTPYYLLIKTPDYSETVYSLRDGGIYYRTLVKANATPSESPITELTYTIPEGIDTNGSTITLYYYYVPADYSADETFIIGHTHSLNYPPMVATTLAELQTAHNYTSNTNQSWLYTVEGATSLAVTFDAQTYTESYYYDPIKVGTPEELESGNFANVYGGSQLAGQTVTVEGDTLAICFKSDGSSNYWGFAVTQIAATMADGSTITITE